VNVTKKYIKLIFSTVFLFTLYSIIHFQNCGINEPSTRFLIQWTAKISACLFAITFSASGFAYFIKNSFTQKLIRLRPAIGLLFFVSHTFHLLFLIFLQQKFHPVFTLAKTSSLIGGGLAYLFIILMAVTTFPYFKNQLSKVNWKILHIVGSYWIWIIFFRSYLRNVLDKDQYHILLAILVISLLLRTAAKLSAKLKTD